MSGPPRKPTAWRRIEGNRGKKSGDHDDDGDGDGQPAQQLVLQLASADLD